METAFGQLLAVILLGFGAVVGSFLGQPCMSPLGLQLEVNEYSLTFDLAASSGDANDIKLNGPRSWRPAQVSGSFLEINISQPVLLTGLQVQGDPQQTGQISGWLLDTSQDCDTYRTQNYSLDPLSPVHTQTVHLKSVEFVSCIRLRPTQFKGKSPALRLELLGCVIEDSSVCDRDVHPVSEMWMESGGRQLNFLHEIVVSWVKILLDLQAYGDTGDAGIFYSRSCDQWHYYEPADTNVISVTSPDQTSSWMTIDLDKPVRAKCLRIFPPFSTSLKEVHTSGCSSHVTTSLHEIPRNNRTTVYETDITAYQEDAPEIPHNKMTGGDAKQMLDSSEEKKKPSVWSDNSRTNTKPPHKQHDVDKAGATTKILTRDSQGQVTRTSVEVSATSTTALPEAREDMVAPLQIGKVNKTMEDVLTKSTEKSAAANLTTASYNIDSTRGNRQNETQPNEVNYNATSVVGLYDDMAVEQTHLMNKTMSNNISDVDVVEDGGQITIQTVENSTVDASKESNNRNTTMGPEVDSKDSTMGLREKTADTSSESPATKQPTASASSVSSLGTGMAAVNQSENHSASIQPDNRSSIIHLENDSSIIHVENDSSAIQLENNNSSAIQLENNNSSAIQRENSNSSAIQLDNNNSSVNHSENNNSDIQLANNNSSAIQLENNKNSVNHSEDNSSAIQLANNNSSITHSENNISVIHQEKNISITHSEFNSLVIHHEEDRISVTHAEIQSSIIHSEGNDSSIQTEGNASDTNDWWRSNCGIKGGVKGYRKKRVISGQRNVPGEWPWLVSMHFLPPINFTEESGFKHLCGASLIAPSWILTAAHCFTDIIEDGLSNASSWRVYFGMHDLAREDDQNSVQERLIDTIYSYPNYDILVHPLIYDIALVKLTEPVDYSDRVSPVCLDDTDIHYEEIPCYVSGWGKLSENSPGTRFPYTASLSTLSPANCKNKYDSLPDGHPVKNLIRIEPPVLCATVGTNGEDACQGDSGGPLMCQHDGRWYQAGVVAAGYLCGNEATPGLYSRISYYFDWIRETMEDNGGL